MKAILFDLDGTLLPMDIELFMKLYFHEMGKAFSGVAEPETLVNNVMKATGVMVKDVSERTNEEVFMDAYKELVDDDIEAHRSLWDGFYDNGYKNVKLSSKESEQMIEAVRILKDKGYTLILVTNPLFPKYAITQRIEWAGLKPDDFSYITSFEENRYCKPHVKIYEEVLKHMALTPEECMMVGNDVEEDMVAGQIGLATYLITDHMLHRSNQPIEVDYQSDYDGFLKFVKELESIE